MYMAFKHIHMLCAVISIVGFIVRGAWALKGSNLLQKKWVRIAPHIVDTLLLLAAIGLMVTTQQYPFVDSWLTAKVIGLLVYIFLGVYTLKIARSQPTRMVSYLLAIATFAYIALVAVAKSPMPL